MGGGPPGVMALGFASPGSLMTCNDDACQTVLTGLMIRVGRCMLDVDVHDTGQMLTQTHRKVDKHNSIHLDEQYSDDDNISSSMIHVGRCMSDGDIHMSIDETHTRRRMHVRS